MESKDRKFQINIVLSRYVEIERFLLLFAEIVKINFEKKRKIVYVSIENTYA